MKEKKNYTIDPYLVEMIKNYAQRIGCSESLALNFILKDWQKYSYKYFLELWEKEDKGEI